MSELPVLVIGGAGFIGSHLVDALVERGPVTVFDDLSVGRREHIAGHLEAGRADLVVGDALDLDSLAAAMEGHGRVYHLAANPEARWGLERPRLDLEQGTIATFHALEAARLSGTPELVFASSGTVYGETPRQCAEEDLGALPISLYGASKLAGEALVSAYSSCFGLRGWIFRFGNVVGPRATHGAALDFLRKLAANHDELEVLGDGHQAKPYLHVSDCVAALQWCTAHTDGVLEIVNLAPAGTSTVARIAELCVAASPYPRARIRYTGGERGWPGDVPCSHMRADRLAALGYRLQHTSDQAVARAVDEIAHEVFGERGP